MLVQCELCPKYCLIAPGQSGDCRIRINIDGVLRSVVYSYPSAIHIDPIEKKPLFHFLPGTRILSLATVGCNLHCKNCQNWEISQKNPEDATAYYVPPETIVYKALKYKYPSIAYTYTEPIVYYEYTLDTAKLAKKYDLKNVLVSAGYINETPWRELLDYIDAANIDLKFMSDKLYRQICSATLKPILKSLVIAREKGIIVEITNLVIPTLNDKPEDFKKISRWIRENLGDDIPLHFSAFFPKYKMRHLSPTSGETLEEAREIAMQEGLKYVYVGNILTKEGQNTYCPKCNKLLVARRGYYILHYKIVNSKCPYCGERIYGVWI